VNKKTIKCLFIGDIVGRPGRRILNDLLPDLKKKYSADLTIVNGENSAGGFGISLRTYKEIIAAGADIITTGNHIWQQSDVFPTLNTSKQIIRPANFSESLAGVGWTEFPLVGGSSVAVVNIQGRIFMSELLSCPFAKLDELLEGPLAKHDICIVDFHAEATSEKAALANYFDGRVSAVLGTHTHVQTADQRVLKRGTAFISDVGMTGPEDSIIGMEIQPIVQKFRTGVSERFGVAKGDAILNGVCLEIDVSSGEAVSIKRIYEREDSSKA